MSRTARHVARPSTAKRSAGALVCLALLLTACGEEPETVTYAALEPASPALRRLTEAQYLASIDDLLGPGLAIPPGLEPDLAVEGLLSIGASISSLSKRGVEQYDAAARSLASQVMADAKRKAAVLGCTPSGKSDSACLTSFIEGFGKRAWRRPLTTTERVALVKLGEAATTKLGSFEAGAEYALAAILQSPNFIYRVELGEGDGTGDGKGDGGARELTDHELASRLSFFLWNGPPDDVLLAAADKGELSTQAQIEAQVDRLMADKRLVRAVRAFFTEWLHLYLLDGLSKDSTIFKHYSADLGKQAREETLRLAEWVVLEQDADMGTFLTARKTWMTKRLAALYNVQAPAQEGFAEVEQPKSSQRQGFLGQVSFLALNAHPVSSSATLRGIFVRESLLCDPVPAPPAGVNTSLPEVDPKARTLRERLEVHMSVPECRGCHAFIDPVGFGMENFDGIGRWRITDNGGQIDASGELDGAPFTDFRELTHVIAKSEKYGRCVPDQLFSYAMGHHRTTGEKGALERLTDGYLKGGRKLKALMRAVAVSEVFRKVGPISVGGAK